ncbi:hypothetical protein SNF32_09250 [Enterococcus mundtii]|nr:hypothetical protein [Enterococcus mundtii]
MKQEKELAQLKLKHSQEMTSVNNNYATEKCNLKMRFKKNRTRSTDKYSEV